MDRSALCQQRKILASKAELLFKYSGNHAAQTSDAPGHVVGAWIVELSRREDYIDYLRNPELSRDLAAFRSLEVEYAKGLITMARELVANGSLKIEEPKQLAAGEPNDEYISSIVIVPGGEVLHVSQPREQDSKYGSWNSKYQPYPNASLYPVRGISIVSDVISGLEKILGI